MAPIPGSPVKVSTGVVVVYAGRESFTFMTPEGHALAAWITFSAYCDSDKVAQAKALERTSDPFIELSHMFGANLANDRFWEQTLGNLAKSLGVTQPILETTNVCVDRRRRWKDAGNVRHLALSMAVSTVTAPARWVRRRRPAG